MKILLLIQINVYYCQDPQVSEENSSDSKEKEVEEEEEKTSKTPSSIGPQPKVDPYGAWVTVEQKYEYKQFQYFAYTLRCNKK